jgi:RNA polymerase sigma-70 factor (ECF subfamily)
MCETEVDEMTMVAMMTTGDLLSRARAGSGEAFRELTEPYRRELQEHCYRMLGSFQDAEDAMQDVMLAAWQGLEGFQERASVRTWLYRIATNRCLNLRRSFGRRAAKEWNIPGVVPPEPTRLGEVPWLEPYPDTYMAEAGGVLPGPETRYERTESISLAFVAALQILPPRQLAVLILRDVLGFRASEVADMLDSTVDSVNSVLKRARAGVNDRLAPADSRAPAPKSESPTENAIVEMFVSAYESADVDAVVALLTDDVFMAMPPIPLEYVGRDVVGQFCEYLLGSDRKYTCVRTRANGQPALGLYVQSESGVRIGTGVIVLTLSGDEICAMVRFDDSVFRSFGLPPSLPPAI